MARARRLAMAGPIALVALFVPLPAPVSAAPRSVERVLIISLPAIGWADLEMVELPHLNGLLDRSAVAALSARAVVPTTAPGDGYATIGAGTRARGLPGLDGLVFDHGERYRDAPADDVYRLRTGRDPGPGPFSLAAPLLVQSNDRSTYEAEVGALGQALEEAGVRRAVIANADRGQNVAEGLLDEGYGREAALALADPAGTVPAGRVDADLLVADDGAPFLRSLDHDAVVRSLEDVWRDRSVVLVEMSDLARLDAYRPSLADDTRRDELLRRTLETTDELVGRLLDRVDPERHAVLVVGPYHRASGAHLTVAGLWAPGMSPGLLDSPTTRRPGFVTLTDVGPTVVDLLGVNVPEGMAGRPFERAASGGGAAERRSMLIEENEAAQFRDRVLEPVTLLVVALTAALFVVAAAARRPGWAHLRTAVPIAALALLAFFPATYVAGMLPFERLGMSAYLGFLLITSGAVAALAEAYARRRPRFALLGVLALVAGVLVIDAVIGAPLQMSTVFGYSPIQGGRFTGLPNVAYAQLVASGFLLAGLLAAGRPGRRGAWTAAGLLAVVALADGLPMWGSDVGGVLSIVPAAGITVSLLFGLRVRLRRLALWIALGLVATMALALIDLARPAESRTHLGRLLESVQDEGLAPLETVVARKLAANVGSFGTSSWVLMVPVVLVAVMWVRRHGLARGHQLWERAELRAALVGLAVASALGFALNDSGIAVPAAMAVVAGASFVHLALAGAAPVGAAPDEQDERTFSRR